MNDLIKLTYQRKGEEIKTMEFKRVLDDINGDYFITGDVKKGGYVIYDTLDINIFRYYKSDGSPADVSHCVTEPLNPLYLEFITSKECPICIGYEDSFKPTARPEDGFEYGNALESDEHQESCTEGKVEVVTQKVLFKPNEYDKKMIRLGSKLEYERPYFEEAEKLELENNAGK